MRIKSAKGAARTTNRVGNSFARHSVLRVFLKPALLSAVFAVGLAAADKDDGVIETKLKMRLAKDPVAKGGGFGVTVTNGIATLTGRVDSEKQKSRAEKLAHKESGVKGVENRLQVIPK